MFANIAAGMAGGAAVLAEMTQAPGQCCKVQCCHVSCISLVPYTETVVKSQVHNLQFLNLKQQSGRTSLQCQEEIFKFKFQNSKMFVSKPFTPVFLRATTAMRARSFYAEATAKFLNEMNYTLHGARKKRGRFIKH
jgi:hypothetical protein